jgi:hypothetical protein
MPHYTSKTTEVSNKGGDHYTFQGHRMVLSEKARKIAKKVPAVLFVKYTISVSHWQEPRHVIYKTPLL